MMGRLDFATSEVKLVIAVKPLGKVNEHAITSAEGSISAWSVKYFILSVK